jgi:hypothetical protein
VKEEEEEKKKNVQLSEASTEGSRILEYKT